MTDIGSLVHILRNVSVRKLIKALEWDGFSRKRKTRARNVIYGHLDGCLVVVHYHRGSDTLPRGTLKNFLAGAG